MKLLKVTTPAGREFYINQDAIESFGADPKTGEVTIYCKGDESEFGYKVAENMSDILRQI